MSTASAFSMSHTELEAKGDRLINKIVLEYTRKGFYCIPNHGHSEGVDIIVIATKEGKVVAVVECKNYAETSHIADDKLKRDIDNSDSYDELPNVEKWLVISYKRCLTLLQIKLLEEHRIRIREIGYEA
jgi:hypothetical protein